MNGVSSAINDGNFVRVRSLGFDRLFLKLEGLNPSGSIKLKTAIGMVEALERQGRISLGTTLIESSSGSLGVALAMIAAERGYKFICVVDPNVNDQNKRIMTALGASLVEVTERDENGGYLGTRIAYIESHIARNPQVVWLNQYENAENPGAHARMTAPAIAEAFGLLDYLFVGAGTTGTLMGCVQYFAEHRPEVKIVAVDSIGSVTFGGPAGKRWIPGLGTSRRPAIFRNSDLFDCAFVNEVSAVQMCRRLARAEGLLVGGSTGTVLAAVELWRDRIEPSATIVVISPDLGERYLDTIYCDDWVIEKFGPGGLATN